MLWLIVMSFSGLFTGLIGGGISAGSEGMIVGGSAGFMGGALLWALATTAVQVRRERRLDRYFQQQDLWRE